MPIIIIINRYSYVLMCIKWKNNQPYETEPVKYS